VIVIPLLPTQKYAKACNKIFAYPPKQAVHTKLSIFRLGKNSVISNRTRHAFASIFALLNKAMAAEECDATGDAIFIKSMVNKNGCLF